MYVVENQKQLDEILSYNIIELYNKLEFTDNKDIEIRLTNKTFAFDCTSKLSTSLDNLNNIIFKGSENTTLLLINSKKESYLYKDKDIIFCKHVNVFSKTSNIIFKNLSLKSPDCIEIIFKNRYFLDKWVNINFESEKIKNLILDEELNEAFKTYNALNILCGFRTEKKYYNKNSYKSLKLGAHLVVFRTLYTHHGIYIGNNKVINYSGTPMSPLDGVVTEVSLEKFVGKDQFCVQTHADAFPHEEIVKRAKMCLGEHNYNLVTNNCEHFANWCCIGKLKSEQVSNILKNITMFTPGIIQTINVLKFL